MRRALALTLGVTLLLGGCNGVEVEPGSGDGGGSKADPKKATKALDSLRIASEGSGSSYERDKFGTSWKDTDKNGCDQRNDVLARDLEKVEKRGDCIVVSGFLKDPYAGKDIDFTRSDASEVQIDHVYPLALAWRMGASRWPADRRGEFANDKDNLIAAWGRPNMQKGDSGPSEWKPRRAFQCDYAAKFVAVAQEYDLPVTRADHDALGDMLATC